MLKGKQKNLDKNKDGKITGEDFKMMKAKYGKMMKAKNGKEIDIDLIEKIAEKSLVGSGRMKANKKMMGGEMKAKKGKMIKTIHSTDHPDVKMTEKLYAKNKIYLGSKEEVAKSLDEIQNKIAKKRTKTEGSFSKGGEMKKPMKAVIGVLAAGAVGAKVAKKLMQKKKEASAISPAMNYLGDTAKKSMGGEMKSTQGYGAARTSGMGLQDEDLIPGKSMDYYKDLM